MKMIKLIIVTILISLCLTDQELEKKLRNEIEALSLILPNNNELYIRNIYSWGEIKRADFKLEQLDQKFDQLALEGEVRNKLKGIVYSSSFTFQGFFLEINNFLGQFQNLVGLAKKDGDNISLILLISYNHGNTLQQYSYFHEYVCTRVFLFFKSCNYEQKIFPRGFNPYEMSVIENTLRFYSHKTYLNLVSSFSAVYLQLLEKIETGFRLQPLSNNYGPAIEYLLQKSSGPLLKKIKSNLEEIEKSINVTMIEDIESMNLYEFINKMNEIPQDKLLFIEDIINFNFQNIKEEYRHNIYRFIFSSNQEKTLKFLEIFVHYSEIKNHFEIEIRKLTADLDLNKDIMLFKYNYQDKYIDLSNDGVSEELIEIGNLFELLSQRKSESKKISIISNNSNELSNSFENSITEPNRNAFLSLESLPKLRFLKEDSFDKLVSSFNKITNVWGNLISIFKSSKSVSIKDKLLRDGFDKFNQVTQVQLLHGLTPEGLNKFSDLLQKRLNVPEDKREQVKNILIESAWMDANIWANFDIIFSINNGGDVKYASIFSHQDENGKFFMVVCEIQSAFQLAPDVLVMTEKLSVLGGIFSNSKDRIEYKPKSLNAEDIQTIFSFFQLIAIKNVAAQFGIGLELPK